MFAPQSLAFEIAYLRPPACPLAGAGVPTVMLFVESLHGISLHQVEETKEEYLELGVAAFNRLAQKAITWLVAGGERCRGQQLVPINQ